jgi:hypothetical protein
MARYFSLDEANAVVTVIRPLMREILDIRQSILAKRPEAWPALEKSAGNGGSKVASELALEFKRLDGLVRQVLATGVEIKDINSGLVDFLALREGREVYLCWQYGEDEIGFWHDLDAGFAGRQAL